MSGVDKKITITIDGKKIESSWGKTILQVARENGIYIPTMCYLTKVEPIASCRMCVVEVEGVEGMILSCQEKAVDGAVVTTNSQALQRERENIMRLYDVNHPLECGVCDKSGECELQNRTLEFDISSQSFSAKDQHRPTQKWGFISYDPSLCIMCERCVRVCSEIVGDEALAISVGGYKSTIVKVKDDGECSQCGECMAVCPVGALVSSDFKYRANAWELEKIPSSCSHCSAGCQLYYEVKHDSIENPEPKIYRVTNEFEFSSLCGAGRFAYDFELGSGKKDEKAFKEAVDAFKKADTIRFSSMVTNEEAMILSEIAKKQNKRLVCEEAYGYQKFLKAYQKVSGRLLYGGDLDSLERSQMAIVLGSRVYDDAPMVKYALSTATKREKAQVVYLHPIEDKRVQNIVTKFIKYEVGSEEGVVALLANLLIKDAPKEIKSFLYDLDIGYLSAESNVSEEELDELKALMWKKKRFTLVVGEDIYNHPQVENIATLLGLIEKYSDFNLIAVPPSSNSLGISLICDLSEKAEGFVVGYNSVGNFVVGSDEYVDLEFPSINQQEGTITTIDKRVVPINPALDFNGYELLDIAREVGVGSRYTIDFTVKLPKESGFRAVKFDELEDYFGVDGSNHRGYSLKNLECETKLELKELSELDSFDGTIIYRCNKGAIFNPFVARSHQFQNSKPKLIGSAQFATAGKIEDGDEVRFIQDGIEYTRVFSIDTEMKGTIAINPTYDYGLSSFAIFSYRFSPVKIEKQDISDE
jgi:NADH-quinone oxidoreductase subunit G